MKELRKSVNIWQRHLLFD